MARERHSPAYPSPRGESMFPADTRRLASRAAWCRCELRTAPMCCVVLIGLTYCASQCTYVQCTCARERPSHKKYIYLHTITSQWCPALDIRHRCDRSQRVSGVRCVGLGGGGADTHTHTHDEERRGPGLRGLVRSDQTIGFHVACLSHRRVRSRSGGVVKRRTMARTQ